MTIVNLLCAFPSANDLSHLSHEIEQVLDAIKFQERQSGNYVDGVYYLAEYGDIRINLALSDEIDHNDLPYWISISSNSIDKDGLIDFANNLVEGNLLQRGFKVARFESFGRVDEQRIDY